MGVPGSTSLLFQAAVERPLNVVFQAADGRWEGHDYRVEVVTERQGLDGFDVVMDFRDLEAALDELLAISPIHESPQPMAVTRKDKSLGDIKIRYLAGCFCKGGKSCFDKC